MKQETSCKACFDITGIKRCFECLFLFSLVRKEVEDEDKNDDMDIDSLATEVDDLSQKSNYMNDEDNQVKCIEYYNSESTITSSDDRNDGESHSFYCSNHEVHPTLVANVQSTSFLSEPKPIPYNHSDSLQMDYEKHSYEKKVEFYNHATWMMYHRIADSRRIKTQDQMFEEEQATTIPDERQQEEKVKRGRSKTKKKCSNPIDTTTSATNNIDRGNLADTTTNATTYLSITFPTHPQCRTSHIDFVDQSKELFHIEA